MDKDKAKERTRKRKKEGKKTAGVGEHNGYMAGGLMGMAVMVVVVVEDRHGCSA